MSSEHIVINKQAINIANHPHCKNCFVYLGIFIISFVLYKYEEKLTKTKISKPSDSS